MAIQVESPAQLSEIGAVFRRRRWWLYVPILFALGVGALLSQVLPEKYEVEMQIKLLEVQYDDEDFFRTRGAEGALERGLPVAEYMVREPSRIHRLIDQLGWVDFQELDALDKMEYVEMVQDNLTVTVLPKAKDSGATFVDFSYRDTDPNRAERFLREVAVQWVNETFRLDQKQIQSKLEAQRGLVATLDVRLEQLRKERRELLSINDLPFDTTQRQRDPIGGDHIFRRKNEAELAISALEIERIETEARLEQARATLDTIPEFVLKSSLQAATSNDDGQLLLIEDEIATLETALANLRQTNPQYALVTARIAELKAQKAKRSGGTAATEIEVREPNPARVPAAEAVRALENALALIDVRSKALIGQAQADARLHDTRLAASQALDRLDGEIANLERQRGERLAVQASYESDLESLKQLGSSFEITSEPLAPTEPSEPNVFLVMFGAVVFGALLGLLLVLAREYLVTGFRLPSDVGADIAVPILGIVGEVTTSRQRLVRRVVGSATGLSTALFLGLVAWFLYAWQERPELLGSDLVEEIERLQRSLR
jgi:uncharacterized protein involved in exopolysaccharide biosynthesis